MRRFVQPSRAASTSFVRKRLSGVWDAFDEFSCFAILVEFPTIAYRQPVWSVVKADLHGPHPMFKWATGEIDGLTANSPYHESPIYVKMYARLNGLRKNCARQERYTAGANARCGEDARCGEADRCISVVYGITKVVPWSFYVSSTLFVAGYSTVRASPDF